MTETRASHISCEQIALFCGVAPKTVDSWLSSGQLSCQELDGTRQVAVDELVDFMHRNQLAIPMELMHVEKGEDAASSVLVIEQDRFAAQRIEEVMSGLSLGVTKVTKGFDATLHCLQKKPALITLDLAIDDMNAIEFIKDISANQDINAKIIVLSDGMPSAMAKAKAAGADVIIGKPIDADTLKRSTKILLSL